MRLRSLVSQLTQHGAIYGIGEISGRIAGFLLIPIYTTVLISADFGRLQVLLSLHQLGQMTGDLGFTAAFLRWYGLAKTDSDKSRVLSNVTAGSVVATLLVTSLFWIFSLPLAKLFLTADVYAPYIRLVAASLGLRVLATVAFTHMRLEEKPKGYVVLSLGRTLLSLSLVLFFVLVQKKGIWGVLLGETIANGAALAVAAGLLGRRLVPRVSLEDIKSYLGFGIPFVLANLGAFALLSTDKLVLSAKGLAVETGLYALGGKLGIAINVAIIWPFTLVWTPTMFRIARDETVEEARRVFARIFTYMMGLLLWAGLALGVFATEIIDIISPPEYASAAVISPFIILAYVVYGSYRHFQVGLNVSGKSGSLATSFLAAAVLNLMLNLFLIPRLGMIGAAIATLISYVVMASLVLIAAQKCYPIPYEWSRVARLTVWCLALYGVSRLLFHNTGLLWPHTALKLLFLVAFPAGVFVLRILTPGERSQITSLLRR